LKKKRHDKLSSKNKYEFYKKIKNKNKKIKIKDKISITKNPTQKILNVSPIFKRKIKGKERRGETC
jgi:hypothetical protein